MTERRAVLARREFLQRLASTAIAAAGAEYVGVRSIQARPAGTSADTAVEWITLLCDRVRAERLSPPVASRVYAYAGVALYEAVVDGAPGRLSLAGQLTGMPAMPSAAGRPHDWEASGAGALAVVAGGIMPWRSPDTVLAFEELRERQRGQFLAAGRPTGRLQDSMAYGAAVGRAILDWASGDGFSATRGLAYAAPVGADQWVPTPPTFAPALEPYWGRVRPFTLEAPGDCTHGSPVPYSERADSEFYRQAVVVYRAVKALRAEQLEIARFWADEPGETGTPPGHWVVIENQLVPALGLRLDEAAEMYARVGLALADAFIACWAAKYQANVVRPITYIRRHIDPRWGPLLMTPPFPEYPSGHSVASAAAAEVLTDLFGTIPFTDRTHQARGLRSRSFRSFQEAATEAAISRLYGGIHYPMAIEDGLVQGRCIGRRIKDLRWRRGPAGSE